MDTGLLPPAHALRLTDLLPDRPGAVANRTLVKQPAGAVILFAFDEGTALKEHTATVDALAQILEGDAEIMIARETLRASAGDVVLLPANQLHALKALTRFKMLLTTIRA